MGNADFRDLAQEIVKFWYNANVAPLDDGLRNEEIYVAWICKALQNNKVLIATARDDGMYFEVTYNGDKHECYMDAYKKADNIVVKGDKE